MNPYQDHTNQYLPSRAQYYNNDIKDRGLLTNLEASKTKTLKTKTSRPNASNSRMSNSRVSNSRISKSKPQRSKQLDSRLKALAKHLSEAVLNDDNKSMEFIDLSIDKSDESVVKLPKHGRETINISDDELDEDFPQSLEKYVEVIDLTVDHSDGSNQEPRNISNPTLRFSHYRPSMNNIIALDGPADMRSEEFDSIAGIDVMMDIVSCHGTVIDIRPDGIIKVPSPSIDLELKISQNSAMRIRGLGGTPRIHFELTDLEIRIEEEVVYKKDIERFLAHQQQLYWISLLAHGGDVS